SVTYAEPALALRRSAVRGAGRWARGGAGGAGPAPGPSKMEREEVAAHPPLVTYDSLAQELDLYDADGCDILDPGVLQEKNGEQAERHRPPSGPLGPCCPPPPPPPPPPAAYVTVPAAPAGMFAKPLLGVFTRSPRWQRKSLQRRARILWMLLRVGLRSYVEKVRVRPASAPLPSPRAAARRAPGQACRPSPAPLTGWLQEKREELKARRLTHGLEPLRCLRVAAGLRAVAQDPAGQRFVVLDGAGGLHLHRADGWLLGKLTAPVALTGLAAVGAPLSAVSRFVGWGPVGLAMLRPDLSLLWLSPPGMGRVAGLEPTCCLPVPYLGLLVGAEAGGTLALWKFRAGGRRLVPCGSPLQPPPSPPGTLARLALGPPPPHPAAHCLMAYGSSVFTFDLHNWALTDVQRDLHKTAISDLVYCGEAKAVVTASRDSTVKVWEADWQIRMVFVGHTDFRLQQAKGRPAPRSWHQTRPPAGPVTSLAALPLSGLLLSASQDGTLRTWDLQAAAQVGEVALSYWGHDGPSGLVSSLLAPAAPGWPLMSLRASSVELWLLSELYSPLAQLSAPVLHLQVAPPLPMPLHLPLPTRLVCACADGSVYLMSAATGRTVSTLLLEPEDRAAAVAYCLPREALWLLTGAGHLLCANTARCPMRVLHRVRAPPPPAPRPCCLHLYSHLRDADSALASWEMARQQRSELRFRDATRPWKDKNRWVPEAPRGGLAGDGHQRALSRSYLPVLGHTDGTLSVLGWRSLKPVFHVEAHGPGPINAIASTWNSIVSSGGDLTVKVWRVFPYAEESLSLLCTFASCHPATALCALGKRITVAFENPDSATYGVVQFSPGKRPRYDHRPQDDPTDHITGLCCCPALKLYASSSLDCTVRIWTAENRLLRLLQLNGAPQALTFCNNTGDLVLAIGSRLCLVSHRLYLPTTYLVKKLHKEVPEVVDDPPLPLTGHESLPITQLQRLTHLHKAASLREELTDPTLPQDLKDLIFRDQDLQQLRRSLLAPQARRPPSGEQSQEAFENYLSLIYGPSLLVGKGTPSPSPAPPFPGPLTPGGLSLPPLQGIHAGWEPHQGSSVALVGEARTWDTYPLSRAVPSLGRAGLCLEEQTVPTARCPQDSGTLCRLLAHHPHVLQPSPPAYQAVHSQASQLLASSSLSSCLGLSLDLQLLEEQHRGRMPVAPEPPATQLQHRVPLLPERRPQEQLSRLPGFFPATLGTCESAQPPIRFPSYVPNSVVLRQMWLQGDLSGLGALAQLAGIQESKAKAGARKSGSEDSLWLPWHRRHTRKWPQKPVLGDEELAWEERHPFWSSGSESSPSQLSDLLESMERETPDKAVADTSFPSGHLLWEDRYGHLPRFLHFFVIQNWFKKLFPTFTLEMYPEGATMGGLASLFLDLLEGAPWAERVYILWALMRLLPALSQELCSRLQALLMHLLNLDQPPSLQDPTQRQFVILALQLLLACSLDSGEVVLELMTYFLCSPPSSRFELKKLLDGLGLKDPQGFLFKEMMSWAQARDIRSKAMLRMCCSQKLEDMMQHLKVQVEMLPPSAAKLSDMLPRVSQPLALPPPPTETPSQMSVAAGTPMHIPVTPSIHSGAPSNIWASPTEDSAGEPHLAIPKPQAQLRLPALRPWPTRHRLSEILLPFSSLPEVLPRASAPAVLPEAPLPLERTEWSQAQWVDLSAIDALNLFCEQQRSRLWASQQEEPEGLSLLSDRGLRFLQKPKAVLPQPPQRRLSPVLRETVLSPPGQRLSQDSWRADHPIRMLKLPLPRVELRPFPPGWPRPARPRPPLPLQPTLQRYFLPENATPDHYR
ncbi:WD repeat-containing protein 97, partial [Galemys pyrenaicus]